MDIIRNFNVNTDIFKWRPSFVQAKRTLVLGKETSAVLKSLILMRHIRNYISGSQKQQESCGAFDQGVNCKLQPISLCLGEDSVCQQLTISFIPLAQLITWYDMRFLKRSIKAPPSALNTVNKASVQSLLFLFLLS